MDKHRCCSYHVKERTTRKLTQVRDVAPPGVSICPEPTPCERPASHADPDSEISPPHEEQQVFVDDDGCDECKKMLWMSDVEKRTVQELLDALARCKEKEKAKSKAGQSQEEAEEECEVEEVECPEESLHEKLTRLRYQNEFLEIQLEKATKEANDKCNELTLLEEEVAPCKRTQARNLESAYKNAMSSTDRYRNERLHVHSKASVLAAMIKEATVVLYEPLRTGKEAILKHRDPWHPLSGSTADLGLDLLTKLGGTFFKETAKQADFASTVAECFERKLVEAAWASYALEEFLAMKGRHTPSGLDMDVDPNFDGPVPPPCPSMKASDWKAVRNSFLFMRESKMNRSILRGLGLSKREAKMIVPAFPDKDEERVLQRCVDRNYFCGQIKQFKGKWVATAYKPEDEKLDNNQRC